jgi:(5-formylfuran-3-yl)methyl phosphate synthase
MKVLISPISLEEAFAVYDGGADIIDIKNVNEGSLGANFPWVIKEVVDALGHHDITFSATLGDLPFKPGTASLAALGAAVSGAKYIKAGLHGVKDYDEALALMKAVVRACRDYDPTITVVAAGYADYRRFNGLDTHTLVRVAHDAGADLVMVDTAIKDGRGLFDALTIEEIDEFVNDAHAHGLQVALAGSVKREHLDDLKRSGADVVGVRGAVCRAGDRTTRIDPALVREFSEAARVLEMVPA